MKKLLALLSLLFAIVALQSADFSRELKLSEPRMHGNDVLDVQNRLLSLGFTEIGEADGWFGPKAEVAVKKYQDYVGSTRNGIVNRRIWQALSSHEGIDGLINDTISTVNSIEKDVPVNYKSSPRIYNYISGPNYSKSEYTPTENNSDSVFLSQLIVAVQCRKGFLVYVETRTPSGDWFVVENNYYDKDGKLIFIKWDMNTSYSSIANTTDTQSASIEKRIYFDASSKQIVNRMVSYKMNTDEEMKFDFADREVEVAPTLRDLKYFKFLKW